MEAPTAADVKSWSKLDFAAQGYADDAAVQVLVDWAVAALLRITGLKLADVPADQVPLVEQAVRGLTEQLAFQGSPENMETLSDWELIQSFSVGPYSETRRTAEDARKARLLNAWPWLSDLLWLLLTPEQYTFWVEFFAGVPAPAFGVTEVDWGYYGEGGGIGWDRTWGA